MEQLTFTKPEGLLAHYTTADVAFGSILPEAQLRMGPYSEMRDPVENKDLLPMLTYYGDPADADQVWAYLLARIKSYRDSARVLSFTAEADAEESGNPLDCCWARPRMWEQYADTHAGVCLVFDRTALEKALRSQLDERGNTYYLGPVKYSAAGIADSPIGTFTDDRLFDGERRDEVIADFVEGHHEDFFFLKSTDWTTEYEYRAVQLDVEESYGSLSYGDSLRAVVLGERFAQWQEPGAREVCKSVGIDLRRILWWNGRPMAPLKGPPSQTAA